MTVHLAIVGAGAIGKQHAEAARAVGIPVAAVVDANLERARQLAGPLGAASHADPVAVFEDDRIDGIVIGVPNRFHSELAIAALESGKDVLLEKPMALHAEQCAEINAIRERTGRLLQIGFAHRYTAVGRAAKEIVACGDLGRIYHAKAHLYCRRAVPGLGGWFTTQRMSGGGALIDLGVHLIDLALHVMDFPQVAHVAGQVYANFGKRMQNYVYESMWAGPPDLEGVCDVEDAAHALIQFQNGATLDLNVTWAGNFPDGALPASLLGFFGEQGGMTFELFGSELHIAHEQHGRNVDTRVKLAEINQMQAQITDFARSIETRELYGATGPQGQRVQEIVDAIYAAST